MVTERISSPTRRLQRIPLSAMMLVLLYTGAVGGARAQAVTYQEDLAGGIVADLTLQNYTLGTQLSNANFVSFSLSSPNNYSFSFAASQLSELTGTFNPSNPTADSFIVEPKETIGSSIGNPGNMPFVEFSQTGDQATVSQRDVTCNIHCTRPGGTSHTQIKIAIPFFAAPEIDATSIGSAMTLLFGGLAVLAAPRRRLDARSKTTG